VAARVFWYVLIVTKKLANQTFRGVPFRFLSSDLAELPVAARHWELGEVQAKKPERNTPNQKRPLGEFWRLVACLVQRMIADGARALSVERRCLGEHGCARRIFK